MMNATRRFARRAGARRGPLRAILRTASGRLTLLLLLVLIAAVILGPILFGADAARLNILESRANPSSAHWLGTDDLGRDVLARVLSATRLTILLAAASVLMAAVLGYALGLAAALAGGRLKRGFVLALNLWLAFPPIVVAIFVIAVMSQSTSSAVVAIGLAFAPLFARTILNLASGVVDLDYIQVAKMLGVGPLRRLVRHIAPNVASPLWIQVTNSVGEAIVALSALSFLGLGVQPPSYDWGSLLAEYLERIFTSPLVVLGPALAITLVGVLLAHIGEAGALAMDPRRWTSGSAPRSGRPHKSLRPEDRRRPPSRHVGRPALAGHDKVSDALLVVDGLDVRFPSSAGEVHAVKGVSFEIRRGETVGIIGESGSGKSVTASAIARLVQRPGVVRADRLSLLQNDLAGPMSTEVRSVLGTQIATVFQNPMSALTPTMRIGSQMTEGLRRHRGLSKAQARERALEALAEVQITGGPRVLRMHPHQLSGGMRQRVVIAMGLMSRPSLLIADEPTTALDVTIQQQILRLLKSLQTEHDMAILFISHDFGVVREVCDRVLVMHDGEIVEYLDVDRLDQAVHPYTKSLLAAVPQMDVPGARVARALDLGGEQACEETRS